MMYTILYSWLNKKYYSSCRTITSHAKCHTNNMKTQVKLLSCKHEEALSFLFLVRVEFIRKVYNLTLY